jgi:hypothetical protein
MSALVLRIESLPSDIHRLFHAVVSEELGVKWANLLAGPIGFVREGKSADFELKEGRASLEQNTCLICKEGIPEEELEISLYEFEEGDPAFYICEECEDQVEEYFCQEED